MPEENSSYKQNILYYFYFCKSNYLWQILLLQKQTEAREYQDQFQPSQFEDKDFLPMEKRRFSKNISQINGMWILRLLIKIINNMILFII